MAPYHRPSTVLEALAVRAERSVTVLAGGTDVFPAKAARVGWGDMRTDEILDISAVSELRGIAEQDDGWRLGSLVTWTDLIRANLPPLFDGVRVAAREVGGVQIQNRGTLAGNICTASPASDGAPNWLALDANVELASRDGRRVVPISSFIDGYRHTVCRPDEIVTAILVPRPGDTARSAFVKLGARKYLVISIVMVAGVLETDPHDVITSARVVVGACSAVPQRVALLESALLGQPVGSAARVPIASHFADLTPIDDIRGSAAYRRDAALALTRDLLSELAGGQQQGMR